MGFRDFTEHLFYLANSDYHACVDSRELLYWQERIKRTYAEVDSLNCKRATERDRDQHRRALESARARLAQSEGRISRSIRTEQSQQ